VSPKEGKQGKPAAAHATRELKRRRLGIFVFGVLFVALFVISASAIGLGDADVPDDSIAVVEDAPDGTITQEDLDPALYRAAIQQGLRDVPPEDDPSYEQIRDVALGQEIQDRWLLGEVSDRGIAPTEREIDNELERVVEQQFQGKPERFEKALVEARYCTEEELANGPAECEGAREGVTLILAGTALEEAVVPQEPEITDEQIEEYYDANSAQFAQPERRDVRQIKTRTDEEATEALAALEEDSTPKGWERVAKEFSTDEATKSTGGLREGVTEGQSPEELDAAIFSAAEGELVGPLQSGNAFYVFRVEAITPAETTPLDEASEQIRQTLISTEQQQVVSAFQTDFLSKWQARTVCADEFAMDRCSNAPAQPDPCTEEVANDTGCGAPVPSTKPIDPGSAGVFGTPGPIGRPQGPVSGDSAQAPALPPGLLPTGPGGAPPAGAPAPPPPAGG
jgi:hypothetical protein